MEGEELETNILSQDVARFRSATNDENQILKGLLAAHFVVLLPAEKRPMGMETGTTASLAFLDFT